MSEYPGKDVPIPKQMAEALKYQPIVHIVPQDDVVSLITSPFIASVSCQTSMALSADSNADPVKVVPDSDNFVVAADKNEDGTNELKFRRPVRILRSHRNNHSNPKQFDLYEGLSPLAKRVLQASNMNVDSECIVLPTELDHSQGSLDTDMEDDLEIDQLEPTGMTGTNSAKRLYHDSSLDLGGDVSIKKSKIGSTMSMNQEMLGQRYMSSLYEILQKIGDDKIAADTDDMEYWIALPDEKFVLTKSCLEKIELLLGNILSLPQIPAEIELDGLKRLLQLMVRNIRLAKEFENVDKDKSPLVTIAYSSANIIFSIFLLNTNERELAFEEYIEEPLEFLSERIEILRDSARPHDTTSKFSIEIRMLQNVANSLLRYINHIQHIDDSISIKLIFLCSEILMIQDIGFQLTNTNTTPISGSWNNLRTVSANILIVLFHRLPDKRMQILDDLLERIDTFPQKRLQKYLRKVDNSIYVNDFTITILKMLESLNCYGFCTSVKDDDEDLMHILSGIEKNCSTAVDNLVEHINNSILNKFFEEPLKYRHSLDHYVRDLIDVFASPKWPAAHTVLASLTKKLLRTLSPSQPRKAANIENISLQLLGQIGCAIFGVKCRTKQTQATSITQLCNFPERIPGALRDFDTCILYLRKNHENGNSWKYLWSLKLKVLFELWYLSKESKKDITNIEGIIKEAVRWLTVGYDDHNPSDFAQDNLEMCFNTVLDLLQVTSLYEPYLQLVLSVLGGDKIKLRSTAIKCLSMLALRDQGVFSHPMVNRAITELLSEQSPASVKDAILDLITIGSSYLLFYREINLNFNADSVMVRKHVLKINEKIYEESSNLEVKIFVASKIVLRLEDEEDAIIEMSRTVLTKHWVDDIIALDADPKEQQRQIDSTLNIMAGVMATSDKCAESLEWFIDFYLLNSSFHTQKAFDHIKRGLHMLVDNLVRKVIDLCSLDTGSEEDFGKKENLLNLLSKFSDSPVVLITKEHIVSLYPYMMNEERTTLSRYVFHILKNSIPKLDNYKPKFLYDVELAVLTAIPKMSIKDLEEAVPLVWTIAVRLQDIQKVARACSSCLKLLNPYIVSANKDLGSVQIDGKLQKLIVLATNFGRFCVFEGTGVEIAFLREDESVHEYVAKCLLVLTRKGVSHPIRRIAVSCLTKLCSSHPRLFNSRHILQVFDIEFESNHLDIQLSILSGLCDFFKLEEERSVKKHGSNKIRSDDGISSFQRLDNKREYLTDSVCSSLVARYLKYILKLCLLQEPKYASISLRLLGVVLQCGYTNPSLGIPTIIALLTATDNSLKRGAMDILKQAFEKYESIVYNCMSKGIQFAQEYSKLIQGDQYYKSCELLADMRSVMVSNTPQAAKFFKHFKRIIDLAFGQVLSNPNDAQNSENIIFLATNISKMSFGSQYELLQTTKSIDLFSEQLKEIICDDYSEDTEFENHDSIKKLQNLAIAQLVFEELRNYLIRLYALRDDILLKDIESETALRSKQAVVPNKSPDNEFNSVVEQIYMSSKNRHFMRDYTKHITGKL